MKTDNTKTRGNAIHNEVIPMVLILHTQSQWNQENRFTGWANPPLTDAGVAEAIEAGEWLHINGYRFDAAYSSRLLRPLQYWIFCSKGLGKAICQDNRIGAFLNATTVLYKMQTRPQRHHGLASIRSGVGGVAIVAGQRRWSVPIRVIISAHGNTLRALLMDLSGMSIKEKEVEVFVIPTATPILYCFDCRGQPLDRGWLDNADRYSGVRLIWGVSAEVKFQS